MFRRIFNYACTTVGALGLTALMVSSAYAVPLPASLSVSPGPIYAGSSFFDVFVEVDIPPLDPLIGFGFNISAPTALGTPTVTSSFFDITYRGPYDVLGTLDPFSGTPVFGNNTRIATLRFFPSTQGNFNIGVTADPNNPNQGLLGDSTAIYSLDLSTTVSVVPNPVPEPATIILIGSGLIALSGIALRSRRSRSKQI